MVKTTVVIDDELLREAMKVIGARTKKQAISAGLRELVRNGQLKGEIVAVSGVGGGASGG